MKKAIITALILLMVFPPHVLAATYYVREDGAVTSGNLANATGCGSAATALSMSERNSSTFASGDTIHYCNNGGAITDLLNTNASDNGVTHDGQPSGQTSRTILHATSNNWSVQIDTPNVTFQNFSVVIPDTANADMGIYVTSAGDNATIDNVYVSGVTTPSYTGIIAVRLSGDGSTIINSELTHATIGVKIQPVTGESYTVGNSGSGNIIHDMDVDSATDGDGLSCSVAAGAGVVDLTGTVIGHNTIYNAPDDLIDLLACSNVIVEYNTLSGNTVNGGEGNGIKLGYSHDTWGPTTGNIARFNKVYGLNGDGNNLGIITSSSGEHYVYGNVVYSVARAMSEGYTTAVGGNTIYNNTFVGTEFGYSMGTNSTSDNTLTNNIISGDTSDIAIGSGSTANGVNNLLANGTTSYGGWTGTYSSSTDKTGDPLVTASYSLSSASPAIYAGVTASTVGYTGPQTDVFGSTFSFSDSDKLNIGAWQQRYVARFLVQRGERFKVARGEKLYKQRGAVSTYVATGDTWQSAAMTWQGESVTWQ